MKLSLLKKANKGYHLLDFIFDPLPNIIEIMFSWELKKDGYNKKAQQQNLLHKSILIIIPTLIIIYTCQVS